MQTKSSFDPVLSHLLLRHQTAPDGWKNSVRHNLSLNKCFVKMESKNGNSSRKGCLWALNPAKVEKMQDELNKWRRKDPITVRRSMARPGMSSLSKKMSQCFSFKQNLMQTFPPQNALIICWERNQTSSSFCPRTTTKHCYPEWHLPIEPSHPRALQLCFNHPACPLSLRSMLTFSLSSPATLLLLLLTPATHLPCTHPSASQLPPEA